MISNNIFIKDKILYNITIINLFIILHQKLYNQNYSIITYCINSEYNREYHSFTHNFYVPSFLQKDYLHEIYYAKYYFYQYNMDNNNNLHHLYYFFYYY